jgi:hypothetical protein
MQKIWNGLIIMLIAASAGISILLYTGKYSKPVAVYTVGDKISCRKELNAGKYMADGWSVQEKEYTWTDGSEASMVFDVHGSENKDLMLKMRASAYLGAELSFQEVEVYANELKIANWKIPGSESWFEAAIASDLIRDGLLRVKFVISDPTAPKDVMKSDDGRKLGIAVRELVICEM